MLTRITVVGALYLTVVALIPEVLFSQLAVSQFIGGTSLLGGRFSILASLLGAMIIQTVNTGILLDLFVSVLQQMGLEADRIASSTGTMRVLRPLPVTRTVWSASRAGRSVEVSTPRR